MKTSVFAPVSSSEFVISVDSADQQMSGYIYHSSFSARVPFGGAAELAVIIEDALDCMDNKKSPAPEAVAAKIDGGKVATFRLEILFRQHNSWQGKLTWIERGAEVRFRSFLELVLILSDIMVNEVT